MMITCKDASGKTLGKFVCPMNHSQAVWCTKCTSCWECTDNLCDVGPCQFDITEISSETEE